MADNVRLILAPLRGVTIRLYREVWARHFGGLDGAVTPFIPLVAGDKIKPKLLAEADPSLPQGLPVVPQVIGRDPNYLRVMVATLQGYGYKRVDLNVGCPWPMVVRKGRGAGMMERAADLRRMLEVGCEMLPQGFSVKLRLGLDNPTLLRELMPLLNDLPLCEVVIHARTARQMYEGAVDLDNFAAAAGECRHRVVYNGDIRSPADLAYLRRRFPTITHWMIGRGVAADPFLPERLRNPHSAMRNLRRLRAFHDDLLNANCGALYGQRPVLGRMKELWFYLSQSLEGGAKLLQQIQRCATLDDYRRIVAGWFELAPDWAPQYDGIHL